MVVTSVSMAVKVIKPTVARMTARMFAFVNIVCIDKIIKYMYIGKVAQNIALMLLLDGSDLLEIIIHPHCDTVTSI